jgi:hypothetical protein
MLGRCVRKVKAKEESWSCTVDLLVKRQTYMGSCAWPAMGGSMQAAHEAEKGYRLSSTLPAEGSKVDLPAGSEQG